MKRQGTVVRFDTDRGFGFIRAAQSSADVFFHIKDFRSASAASPRVGMLVSFDEIHVGGKGPRAMAVQLAEEDQSRHGPAAPVRGHGPATRRQLAARPSSGAWFFLLLVLAYAAALLWGVWTHRLPWWTLPALAALNLVTFLAYWQDKYAAQQDRWRIAESTLHLWSLAGGWIGAWLAQQLLSHKTRKAAFLEVFWFTVAAHSALLGTWMWWNAR